MASSPLTTIELFRLDEPLNSTERGAIAGTPEHADQLHDRSPVVRRVVHHQRGALVRGASRSSGDLRTRDGSRRADALHRRPPPAARRPLGSFS